MCLRLSEMIFNPSNTREENAKLRFQFLLLCDLLALLIFLFSTSTTHFLMPISFAMATLGWFLLFQGFDVGAITYALLGGLVVVCSIIAAAFMAMKENGIWNYLIVELVSVVVVVVPLCLQPDGFSYEGVPRIDFNPNYNPNLPGVATAVAIEMMET